MDFFTDLMGLILLIVCILTISLLVVCILIISLLTIWLLTVGLLTISCIHLRYSLCIFVCSVLHKRICNNSKSKYLKKDV